MTRDLPSLAEPPYGSKCPDCGEPIALENFCSSCFERFLEGRDRAIAAEFAEARKRARTWQLGRAVQS